MEDSQLPTTAHTEGRSLAEINPNTIKRRIMMPPQDITSPPFLRTLQKPISPHTETRPIIPSIKIPTPGIPNKRPQIRTFLERRIGITSIRRIRPINIGIDNGNIVLIIRMQARDEILHSCRRVRDFVIREIAVELVYIDVVPHALERDVGISVPVDDGLDDGDVLVAPAALVEAKGPEHLHGGCANTTGLELADGFQRCGGAAGGLAAEEVEVEAPA